MIPEDASQTNLLPPDPKLHPTVNLVRIKTLSTQLSTSDIHPAQTVNNGDITQNTEVFIVVFRQVIVFKTSG